MMIACFAAAPAGAQNLLPGGDFDSASDLTAYWGNLGSSSTWSSEDFEGSPASGSLRVSNDAGASTFVGPFTICLPVTPGASYTARAWQLTPLSQPASGFARLFVQWRESCPSGAFAGGDETFISGDTGVWTEIDGIATAPANANGARVWATAAKTTGTASDPFVVYFDAVFLPEPAAGSAAALVALAAFARRRRP